MCLASRLKRPLDTEVQHRAAGPEPAAAATGQRRRLGEFGHAEQAAVELARLVLGAGRDGHLDVVDAGDHLCATTNVRRNGNTVPCSVAGYAVRSRSA